MSISNFSRHALGFCMATAMLAGCGGSQTSIAPGVIPQSASASTGSYLYAEDCCGVFNSGDINVYDLGLKKVVRRIVKGAFNPMAIAVDRTGTLYVLNQSYGYAGGISVTEYDRGSTKPSRRIDGFYWGVTLALDQSNNLYVANCNTCVDDSRLGQSKVHDSVTVYQAHQTTLLRTITQGVYMPQSLAFDPAGNLYVGNLGTKRNHPSVTVYAPGSTSLERKIAQGITRPELLATDTAGDLFVANGSLEVLEYAPESSKRLRGITDEIASPQALVVDASGTLYVDNTDRYPAKGWISVYAPGSSTSEYRIVSGIDNPVALAVDGSGDLYVANDDWGEPGKPGRIDLYPAHARKPMQSIKGGHYGLPFALALGPG